MMAKTSVVIEPPKRWPPEDHEIGTGSMQPLDLPDRCFVVGGRCPVLTFVLGERNDPTARNQRPDTPLGLVDQNEHLVRRHQLCDVVHCLSDPLLPWRLLCALSQGRKERQVARGALVDGGMLFRQVAEPA